jgi:hypothetical protein
MSKRKRAILRRKKEKGKADERSEAKHHELAADRAVRYAEKGSLFRSEGQK